MRSWLPVLAAVVLLAGCSQTVDGRSQPVKLTPLPSASKHPPPSPAPTAPPTPPAPGAPIEDVVAWIQAGDPVDTGAFHTATRDGTETQLGDDVGFVTPSGKTQCMTFAEYSDALMCLVKFTHPPQRPPDFPTAWVGDWVDFDGASVSVGSPHGDPGPFTRGDGPELAYGKTLKFGDYQCRVDQVGLYCANFAHQTAVKLSDAGVEPFGCLKSVAPAPDIGLQFGC
jgi:hypothetical protein